MLSTRACEHFLSLAQNSPFAGRSLSSTRWQVHVSSGREPWKSAWWEWMRCSECSARNKPITHYTCKTWPKLYHWLTYVNLNQNEVTGWPTLAANPSIKSINDEPMRSAKVIQASEKTWSITRGCPCDPFFVSNVSKGLPVSGSTLASGDNLARFKLVCDAPNTQSQIISNNPNLSRLFATFYTRANQGQDTQAKVGGQLG